MVARVVACFVIASASLFALHAQDNKPTSNQARVSKNVTSSSEPLEVIGPIDVTLSTPGKPSATFTKEQYVSEENLLRSKPPVVSELSGPELAGPSAVLAATKLSAPNTESFSFGESLFFLDSQRTQGLTTKWASGASANGGQDPQIAAGHSVVAVLTWNTLAFYDKSGNLLTADPAHPKQAFINPTSTAIIFAGVVKLLDDRLHLNPITHNDPSFLFQPDGEVGDARVIFDNFRNRWVVLATAKNNHPHTTDFRLLTSQRRTKFLLAISRDEDPRHGFRAYGFNADPNDGACDKETDDSPCPGSHFTPGNGADYPSLGVSKAHYIMTIGAGHAPLDGSSHTNKIAYMVTVNAKDAADGTLPIHMHAIWDWDLGEGDRAVRIAMPAVMQNDLPVGGAGWGVVASTASNHLILTAVGPTDPPALVTLSWDMPNIEGAPGWPQKGGPELIDYGNVSNQPITATMNGRTLTAGFVDCRTWTKSQKDCSPSLHLVSIDVSVLPVAAFLTKDRVVGWRSVLDDASDDVVAYGLPGIASNNDGDIAVVYGRTSPRMFMETRFSAWLHNEVDIRPSRELQKGRATLPVPSNKDLVHPDTAGVSIDPFDGESIWIAHTFADTGPSQSVAVGKVFGEQHPDLSMESAQLTSPATGLKPDDAVSVHLSLHNGGDGTAPASRVELVLVAADGKKTSLAHTTPVDMKAGATIETDLAGNIPAKLSEGAYTVELRAKLQDGVKQYSEDNDVLTAGEVHLK